nr:hypothetical protein [Tardiphaga sp. vice278]
MAIDRRGRHAARSGGPVYLVDQRLSGLRRLRAGTVAQKLQRSAHDGACAIG